MSDVESQATTQHGGEESKSVIDTTQMAAQSKPAAAQNYQQAEDDFDEEFFGRKVPKIKLNKGEKRQLKFELRAGVNINEVGDLKTYLNGKMKAGKETHNTAR